MLDAIKRHLWFIALFGIASNVLVLAPTIYLLQVYDRVLPSRSLETLSMMLAVDLVRHRLLSDLGRQLADRLDRLALAARIDTHARRLSRPELATAQDVAALRAFLSGSRVTAFLDMPWLVVYLGLMFLFHWSLGLIAIVSALLLVGLTLLNDRLTENSVRAYTTRQRETDQMAAQISRNAEIVTVLGMNAAMIDAWSARRCVDLDAQVKAGETSSLNRSIGKALRQVIQAVMMGAGAWLVINQFATGGVMLATTILLGKALAPVEQMLGSWKQFTEVRQAWTRLDALYRSSPERRAVELPRPTGRLTVEALAFSSYSATGPRGRMLLKGIQFVLNPGQLLVIVGASASGKSTLLLSWLRAAGHGAVRRNRCCEYRARSESRCSRHRRDCARSTAGIRPRDDPRVAQRLRNGNWRVRRNLIGRPTSGDRLGTGPLWRSEACPAR
jgi:ABC-type protease/lipase transport system fused ATPase/permease subunit